MLVGHRSVPGLVAKKRRSTEGVRETLPSHPRVGRHFPERQSRAIACSKSIERKQHLDLGRISNARLLAVRRGLKKALALCALKIRLTAIGRLTVAILAYKAEILILVRTYAGWPEQ
jgi:hypothetical protein